MGLPVFVCFVPLVEEMAYINERLSARTPPAIYRSGKFDKKRLRTLHANGELTVVEI